MSTIVPELSVKGLKSNRLFKNDLINRNKNVVTPKKLDIDMNSESGSDATGIGCLVLGDG